MPDGILSGPIDLEGRRRRAPVFPPVAAALGLVVHHRLSGVTGAVMEWRPSRVTVMDRTGRRHQFVNERGAFSVDGQACTLVAPGRPRTERRLTSSGSVAVGDAVALVARGARIWVEGTNDAELVEHVWGDDLRVEGVVVEPMGGMDDLDLAVARFGPGPGRRLGVLLDHMVAGSKEERTARLLAGNPHVLVTGHPFVDVWGAIDPQLAGLAAWPQVPRGVPWKDTVARQCGFDRTGRFWTSLLRRVRTYADLHPTLVGAVERLIDFVTEPVPDELDPATVTDGTAGGSRPRPTPSPVAEPPAEVDPSGVDPPVVEPPAPWRRLNSREVYRNPWLRLEEHVVGLPNGHETLYGVVRCSECVGMLPFVDDDTVLLVGQWRYVIGRATWEIPTGALHRGEAPEDGAQRELAEEVGQRAGRLLPLTGFDSSKSILEEHAHLFCCFDLTPAQAAPDATELLVVRQVAFEEALGLVLSGEIVDAMSIIAILWTDRLRRTSPWPPSP